MPVMARDAKGPRNYRDGGLPSAVVTGGFFDGPTHALTAEGADASEDGTGRGTPIVPVEICPTINSGGNETGGHRFPGSIVDTADSLIPVAVSLRGRNGGAAAELSGDVMPAIRTGGGGGGGGGDKPHALTAMRVRRLTPRECERLQGFPDDWTLIPTWRKAALETGSDAERLAAYYFLSEQGRQVVLFQDGRVYATPDGPRYKALGNSMAVNVMRWIGERIQRLKS